MGAVKAKEKLTPRNFDAHPKSPTHLTECGLSLNLRPDHTRAQPFNQMIVNEHATL